MCEEREGWSDDISPVKSSAKKTPPSSKVAEWSTCALSERKNAVSSMQDQGASVKEKKELCGEQNPLQGKVQNVGSSYPLPDEPRLLQMINIMHTYAKG